MYSLLKGNSVMELYLMLISVNRVCKKKCYELHGYF